MRSMAASRTVVGPIAFLAGATQRNLIRKVLSTYIATRNTIVRQIGIAPHHVPYNPRLKI